MNCGHQETSLDIQETEFGGPAVSKQRRVIHFSSGETLEQEDSEEEEEEEEEEEQSSRKQPFKNPTERTKFSFRNVAFLVGKISLMTCDFLGERLAAAFGLNAAKYQYAIDQYHRDQKTTTGKATADLTEGPAETIHLSPGPDANHYGATGDIGCPAASWDSCDDKHMEGDKGCHNRGYEAE